MRVIKAIDAVRAARDVANAADMTRRDAYDAFLDADLAAAEAWKLVRKAEAALREAEGTA